MRISDWSSDVCSSDLTMSSFKPSYHDNTLFFDDDGRIYLIYGGGQLRMVELAEDLSGVKPGTTEQVIIENATAPAGPNVILPNVILPAAGSQLFKVNGMNYQNGRSSCRERGCQYVQILVVGVSLKKKSENN